MPEFKTKTLWLIATGSLLLFLFSPLLGSFIGHGADLILVRIWAQTRNPATVWDFITTGEYVYGFALGLIALTSIVCGGRASYLIYQRHKKTI